MIRAMFAAAAIAAGAAAHASITTDFAPTSDGAVQSSGVLGISIADNPTNRTSRSGGNNVRNAVYEFDLSALPAGAIITGATFNVTTSSIVSNVGSAAQDVRFITYAGDGVIDENDYQDNTAGTIARTESGLVGLSNGTDLAIALDVLTDVQAAADGSGLLTLRSQTFNFVTFSVHSLETTATGVLTPSLSITYIPTPATAALGVLGLGLVRRRR